MPNRKFSNWLKKSEANFGPTSGGGQKGAAKSAPKAGMGNMGTDNPTPYGQTSGGGDGMEVPRGSAKVSVDAYVRKATRGPRNYFK